MKSIAIALLVTGFVGTAHAVSTGPEDQQQSCVELIQSLKTWSAIKDLSQTTYYREPSVNNKNLRVALGFKVRGLMTDVNAACGTTIKQSPGEADPR